MLTKIESKNMGSSNLRWLRSKFHFSFSEYYNPDNINFGVLRVINDDLVESRKGFGFHPHSDIEIISYVVKGELTHSGSMEIVEEDILIKAKETSHIVILEMNKQV